MQGRKYILVGGEIVNARHRDVKHVDLQGVKVKKACSFYMSGIQAMNIISMNQIMDWTEFVIFRYSLFRGPLSGSCLKHWSRGLSSQTCLLFLFMVKLVQGFLQALPLVIPMSELLDGQIQIDAATESSILRILNDFKLSVDNLWYVDTLFKFWFKFVQNFFDVDGEKFDEVDFGKVCVDNDFLGQVQLSLSCYFTWNESCDKKFKFVTSWSDFGLTGRGGRAV